MQRKHNPLVALLALLLLAFVLTFVLDGCAVHTEAATESRFTKEYHHISGHDYAYVITDNETGVQYLAYAIESNYGRGVGLTKLEVSNENGSTSLDTTGFIGRSPKYHRRGVQ